MFVAIGVSAYNIAIFHLFTHAFFKALLFLGAGSVIHAMSDQQDIKKMGGLYKKIPVTYILMLVGTLSLVGFPFFSAYYSKDLIMELVFLDNSFFSNYVFINSVLVVFLTSFYSFRLLLYVFHGKNKSDEKVLAHVHEAPNIMLLPLVVLSFFSIFSGLAFKDYFFGIDSIVFWGDSLVNISLNVPESVIYQIPFYIKKLPLLNVILGFLFSIVMILHFAELKDLLKKKLKYLVLFLKRSWFFDDFYNFIFVKSSNYIGNGFWKSIDEELIDNVGPNGMARIVKKMGSIVSSFQTGFLYHYAFVVIIGLTVFISIYFYLF
tara:strand:- start:2891 stop:3850 length:960 start_codon:yes stop_codon:yes gene_type:complete